MSNSGDGSARRADDTIVLDNGRKVIVRPIAERLTAIAEHVARHRRGRRG